MNPRTRVGLLFGGPSAEHEVSCASALAVARALSAEKYDLTVVGVTKDGGFRHVPQDLLDKLRDQPPGARAIDDHLEVAGPEVGVEFLRQFDVVFPVLHGPFGEDGVLQGLLEWLGVPYVGCGVAASATGMDKVAMKRAFRAEGIPVTNYVVTNKDQTAQQRKELVAGLKLPLFVKPANMGSSIGISRVTDMDDLETAVQQAFSYDPVVLVEQGVTARELETGVLGGFSPAASVTGEVTVAGGWFDYQQKYYGDADPMIVPAQLPDGLDEQLRELSIRAFQAVGCWGLARIDFLYDEANNQPYVNELNTLPGFTAHSMYPKVWAASGIGYAELLDKLIALAFERQALRKGAA
ncbi:D-alanine--D-alanine ligase family protein [Actinocrispum sp. NPDC049592]|uniref:D-alanine--D-alanine ligase family protein n=1 Tax=Actinocrispum sp. NPDC049592 TaxID=3154835 RepID=UPI003429AEAA